VTGTTYPLSVDAPVLGGTIVSMGVLIISAAGVVYGARWRLRTVPRSRYIDATTEVYRLWKPEDLPTLRVALSPLLAPFLDDFVRKAVPPDRQAILDDFWGEVDEGLPASDTAGWMRKVRADLPDDPTPEQVEAWIELVELVRDPDFRAKIRSMAVENVRMTEQGDDSKVVSEAWQTAYEQALTKVTEAIAAGQTPESEVARRIVADMRAALAAAIGRDDDAEFSTWLGRLYDTFADDRAERYWTLLGIINAWPEYPSPKPARDWLTAATRSDNWTSGISFSSLMRNLSSF